MYEDDIEQIRRTIATAVERERLVGTFPLAEVREAFDRWLPRFLDSSDSIPPACIGGHEVPAGYILGRLATCTEQLPDASRERMQRWLGRPCLTYSKAVWALRRSLAQRLRRSAREGTN